MNKISNWSIDRNGLRCNHYDSIKSANYIKHAIQANTANTSVIEKGSRGKIVPKTQPEKYIRSYYDTLKYGRTCD